MIELIAEYINFCLILSAFLPIFTCFIPILFRNEPLLQNSFNIICSFFTFLNFIYIALYVNKFGPISIKLCNIIGYLSLAFTFEPLGVLFALFTSFLWLMTIIYSIGYFGKDHKPSFYSLMSLSMICTFAIAFAENLFTIFIFYELLTFASYPLIIDKGAEKNIKAAKTYLFYLLGLSAIFSLPAIIIIANIAGTLDFTAGGILIGKISPYGTTLLLAFFILGTGKIAIMPFHKWLPVAMVAPVPVSALLHAVAVVKSGIFIIIKSVIYIFGIDNLASMVSHHDFTNNWLIALGCFSIIASSIIAFKEREFKKILAYSTICNLSYCILSVAIFTQKAIYAAIFHMIAHAFNKISLFFIAGLIEKKTGETNIEELNGVFSIMPFTSIAFMINALSIIGIPPLAIFFTKYYILSASWDSNHAILIIISLVISSLFSANYFIPIIHRFFWRKSNFETINTIPNYQLLIFPFAVTTFIGLFITYFLTSFFLNLF